VYYSYGENVYYEGDSVYYGDQVVATADEYAQQAQTLVASAPEVGDNVEWMSLGVFALTQDGQASGPEPSLFLQLAISKEGVISGTLNNKATNETQTVEGVADKKSQRSAWNVVGKTRPIMETGIFNLTEDDQAMIMTIQATSIKDFATQLVRLRENNCSGEWVVKSNYRLPAQGLPAVKPAWNMTAVPAS